MAAGGSHAPSAGAPRALVVDDAPELQEIVVAVLEQEGYAVEATASGRDGVERGPSCRAAPTASSSKKPTRHTHARRQVTQTPVSKRARVSGPQ